ncbi:MAG: hypothetical protein ABL971_03500 [Vicinamibacterales bacterium]
MHIGLWFEALESAFSVDGGTPLSFLAEVPRLSVEYVPRDPNWSLASPDISAQPSGERHRPGRGAGSAPLMPG